MIQDLKRQYMFLFGTEEIPNGIGMFIENFPSADVVEVVHGEWIDVGHDNIYKCSKCGDMWMGVGGYNYCPNCGARMDGTDVI